MVLYSTDGRALVLNSALLSVKSTRSTIGVAALTLRKKALLDHIRLLEGSGIQNISRYRSRTCARCGRHPSKEDDLEDVQLTMEL